MAYLRLVPVLLMAFYLSGNADAVETSAAKMKLFAVHFSVGPNWQADLPPSQQDSFANHSANLRRLHEAGRIRFGARYGELGLIFLEAADLAAAQSEIALDPGVVSGIFEAKIEPLHVFFPWREQAE